MYRITFRGLVILMLAVAAMALVNYLDYRRDPKRKQFSLGGWCWVRLRNIDLVDALALFAFGGLGAMWATYELAEAPVDAFAAAALYAERLLGIGIFLLGGFYMFLLARMFVEDAILVWFRRSDGILSVVRRGHLARDLLRGLDRVNLRLAGLALGAAYLTLTQKVFEPPGWIPVVCLAGVYWALGVIVRPIFAEMFSSLLEPPQK